MDIDRAATELGHLSSDLTSGPHQTWPQQLRVLLAFLRENPVTREIVSAELKMSPSEFDHWYKYFLATGGSMVGPEPYSIPGAPQQRAALFFALLERFDAEEIDHEDFATDAFGKTKYAEITKALNSAFVLPLVRYVRERLDALAKQPTATLTRESHSMIAEPGKRVFIVHGHDERVKEQVARFLEKGGLEVVILHEQANAGGTVIEKFERHAQVDFAVVLLTPDDVGAARPDANNLRARARQNVVLELGYFFGTLGRKHVCALYVPGVELPSDIHGLLFVELDNAGAWKLQLFKELRQAGMRFDVEKAF